MDDLTKSHPSPPTSRPMPPPTAKRSLKKHLHPVKPQAGEPCDGFRVFGDLAGVKDLFKPRPKKSVTLGMARSVKARVSKRKSGLGDFLEEAIMTFDGDLTALWIAAQHFCECRRSHAPEDSIENATARISWNAFDRLELILEALRKGQVIGATRSRALSGLVELRLRAERASEPGGKKS